MRLQYSLLPDLGKISVINFNAVMINFCYVSFFYFYLNLSLGVASQILFHKVDKHYILLLAVSTWKSLRTNMVRLSLFTTRLVITCNFLLADTTLTQTKVHSVIVTALAFVIDRKVRACCRQSWTCPLIVLVSSPLPSSGQTLQQWH